MEFFNLFARSKGRSRVVYSDLDQFFTQGTICTRCASKDTECLTMHAYIVSDNTARLHQSASLFRNSDDPEYKKMVGRSNRLLHWDDILYFKSLGIKWYDFGGWYGGPETTGTYKEQLLINQFKESFGGQKKQEYSFILPSSTFGRLSILFHKFLKPAGKSNNGKKPGISS
jgi:hypothetical protein